MPSFIKGLKKGKIGGKGIPALTNRPRKVCPICGLLFDHAFLKPTDDVKINAAACNSCQEALDAGQIAFVCGDEYAFAKSDKLSDMQGTIVRISPHVFEEIKKQFGEVKRKSNGDNPDSKPAQ